MKDPRSSSATPLVIGAILLLAAASLVLAVLPLATCPACHGSGKAAAYYEKGGGDGPPDCWMCERKGRVTPLQKWTSPWF